MLQKHFIYTKCILWKPHRSFQYYTHIINRQNNVLCINDANYLLKLFIRVFLIQRRDTTTQNKHVHIIYAVYFNYHIDKIVIPCIFERNNACRRIIN